MKTTSTEATLRPARTADLPAIERLLTQSGLPLAGVTVALDGFLVAESGGELVGVAGLETRRETALLRSVAVAPEWRSRGVGRALVTRLIEGAAGRGLRSLYLLTTTAERYFPAFGFVPILREQVPPEMQATEEFASACPATAVVMALGLPAVVGKTADR
jgi:amino-acid N-acetyltransferase